MLLYQNRINLCYLIVYKDILLKYYSCQGIDSRCWIQNIIFKILYVFVRQLESRWQMKREPDWNFQNEIDARDHHSHRYNLHLISTCILFADRHSQICCQQILYSKFWLLSNAWGRKAFKNGGGWEEFSFQWFINMCEKKEINLYLCENIIKVFMDH